MVPLCETFNYLTVVPSGGARASPWLMGSSETFVPTGSHLTDNRLVGWNPLLHISDAGLTPNPGPTRPAVLRSELRFVSQDEKYAQSSSVSYYLDRVLMNAMRPGDVFHMARTICGGLGVSALRQDNLIFAAGAISAVPLGSRIQAKITGDLILAAERIFRQHDPEFYFPEQPNEIRDAETCNILFHGSVRRNGYHIWVRHGAYQCDGGTEECLAISLDGHVTTRPYVPPGNSSKYTNSASLLSRLLPSPLNSFLGKSVERFRRIQRVNRSEQTHDATFC
jgi:hypothetical protein